MFLLRCYFTNTRQKINLLPDLIVTSSIIRFSNKINIDLSLKRWLKTKRPDRHQDFYS
jgi:hypothetical protein